MIKKIVLVGAGSSSFGPSMFTDLYLSETLRDLTIFLHDINKDKLEMIYELLQFENKRLGNKFTIERSIDRNEAFKNANFIINSIEVGSRFDLWRQDYKIPRECGSTQILGECGGPGGIFHAWRIIPPLLDIVRDAEKICPNAFFINFSNPMARVCLAIKRATNLKFIGLCHEIASLFNSLPHVINRKPKDLIIKVAGLNHFAFLLDVTDRTSGESLMKKFNQNAMKYYKSKDDPWKYSKLTFKVYEKFGYFPYTSDSHLGEYLQFAHEHVNSKDMVSWITRTDKFSQGIYDSVMRYYKRLKKGRYPKKGLIKSYPSGERAIPIIEAIVDGKNTYETAVNVPNKEIISNLPEDLVVEVPVVVDRNGVKGIKIGLIPKQLAAILRIEATVQDLCVEAVLQSSKDIAIATLAVDPNIGSIKRAEAIFDRMYELQKDYLPEFA